MKRTIKLLILLLVIIVGMFSYVNYTLANEFSKIDQDDKFYEYNKHLDLAMDGIKITGGNKLEIKIEKGETNGIYIHKDIAEKLIFNTDKNLLSVEFDSDFTDSVESPENIRINNRSPRVIITYTDVNQIWANDTRLTFDCAIQNKVDVYCKGSTMLAMNMNGLQSGKLNLNASDKSRINIEQSDSVNSIAYAVIKLTGESYLKMNQFRTDSLNLSMDDLCRIDCDNHLFKQLSNSNITK